MPGKHDDLHGNAPDRSPTALLLVDVINDLEFEGGEQLLEFALPAARGIAELKQRAARHGIPTIYANDNFGRWQSNLNDVVQHCLEDGVRGEPIVELLRPGSEDYFVLKPKHSAFFATPLELLLKYLEVDRLVLCGFSGDQCVLLSAADAYLRDLHLHVPSDCVASMNPRENARALAYMQRNFDADIAPAAELDLSRLSRGDGEGR
ncbi:MAG TPA: isochorismatase family cysteine hydrolase [Longimicrobiaceae bacterium]